MRYVASGVVGVSLLLASTSLVFASCRTDDPDGSKTAAARATADQTCSSMGMGCDSGNHGAYVSCVAQVANDLAIAGTLPVTCKGAVKKCAAKSTCGKPGFVNCCLTNPKGTATCKLRKDAASCAARNGTVSACTTCCDACPAPGSGPSCPAPTTTTTTMP